MRLSESSLNTISKPFILSHCRVPCDSPCCTNLCGEDDHCVFNIDTHEHINSDSDEDEDKYVSNQLNNSCNNIYVFASVVQVVVLGGEVYCPNAASAWENIKYTDTLYLVYRYSALQCMCFCCLSSK